MECGEGSLGVHWKIRFLKKDEEGRGSRKAIWREELPKKGGLYSLQI